MGRSNETIKFPKLELELIKYKISKRPSFFGRNKVEDYEKFYSKALNVSVRKLPPHPLKENISVEELKTRLFKTSRPKSALIINEACEKGFFYLEKTSDDQRKKYIKPSRSFINEFNEYLKTLRNLSF